jgi:hypothetical protein
MTKLTDRAIKAGLESLSSQRFPKGYLGWSSFALNQQKRNARFNGKPDQLLKLIEQHWTKRTPGYGRKDLSEVVVVPIPAQHFSGTTATLRPHIKLKARRIQRRRGENWYVDVTTNQKPDRIRFASVVLYSKATLAHEASGKFEWEIVTVLASPVEKEPMQPITMARNFLKKKGGTFAPYTAEQFAEAIWYWADKVRAK